MSTTPWLRAYRPLAVAHRGHSIATPENTMVAFRRAIELGAEMIECDVNITRDEKLVMMHDPTLDRTTSGTGRVSAATWEEIQRLDAGCKFKPEFTGVKVPCAEEALLLYKEAGILSCIEVKGADADESTRIALGLVDLFIKDDMLDKAFLSSYHHAALHKAQAKCSELLLAPERLPDDAPPNPSEALRQAQSFNAPVLQHQYTVLNADVVHTLHENEIAVWSWSTPDEPSMRFSIDLGADALMSDDVELMMDVLNQMRRTPLVGQVKCSP
ncbi:MAG TPA: glycerophosphodiester phosphodiesterase family protein [Anaerolineales bacterium]|nr:glycerophosphodiester phosphodiesterase family protein [Anaerolineales bacterium]